MQEEKQLFRMTVTEAGMQIECRFRHSTKADFPIRWSFE
jgi:hypothetical protein